MHREGALALIDSLPVPACRFARADRCRSFRSLAAFGHQGYGYITMERTKTRTGAHAGLRIIVMPRLMPFYVFENQAWPGGARDVKTQDFQEGPNLPKGVPSKPPDRAWG